VCALGELWCCLGPVGSEILVGKCAKIRGAELLYHTIERVTLTTARV